MKFYRRNLFNKLFNAKKIGSKKFNYYAAFKRTPPPKKFNHYEAFKRSVMAKIRRGHIGHSNRVFSRATSLKLRIRHYIKRNKPFPSQVSFFITRSKHR